MGNCFGQKGWSWKISRSSEGDQDPIINENEEIPNDRSVFRLLKFKRRKLNTRKFINRILKHRPGLSSQELDYVELDGRGAGSRGQRATSGNADISLQYLDAKSLLMLARGEDKQMQYREFGTGTTANSSQYGSSLDLEWENDYENGGALASAANQMMWFNIKQPPPLAGVSGHNPHRVTDKSPSSLSSESSEKKDNSIECSAKVAHEKRNHHSWSHISTPESMEWDVVTEDNQLKSEDCDSVDQDTRDLLFEIEQLKNRALRETGLDYDLNKFSDETETS